MQIIHHPLADWDRSLPRVGIAVERLILAKRRWRGLAEDGSEFGFDLATPLKDADVVFQNETVVYFIAQKYETVLEVALGDDSASAARLGWMIGNLHFQIEVLNGVARVADDPAVRQLFAREGVAFIACKRVFHPLSGAHQH